jgi:hypothetical protein
MKNKSPPDRGGVFLDPASPPEEREFQAALGTTHPCIEEVLAGLRPHHGKISSTWKHSRQAGWYRVYLAQQRRIFYLLPRRDGFRLTMILGDRAIESLAGGRHAAEVLRRLKTAIRYPEGTAFAFTHSAGDVTAFDAEFVIALMEAKLAH